MASAKALKFIPRKNALHVLAAIAVILVCIFGIIQALHSSLFSLNTVTVEPLSKDYPLSAQQILNIARVETHEKTNLFGMDLKPIEMRLLKQPWIKGVVLEKRFPASLLIKVIERNPTAMVEGKNGKVLYLEADGTIFEDASLSFTRELPILSGVSPQDSAFLKKAGDFILHWFDGSNTPGLKLSSMNYDEKLGLRAVIVFTLKNGTQMRALLEMGINIDEASQVPQARLMKVLSYLSEKSMPVSKIWLGDGKKIVVKVARSS